MSEVITALERDHANMAKLLDILESEILAIEVGKTPDYSLLQDIMRYMAQHADRFHHPKEDLIFAQLLKRDPRVRAEIDDLLQDHVSIRLAGQEFDKLLRASSVDSIVVREQLGTSGFAYVFRLRDHMSTEEKQLFPLAREALTIADWRIIDGAVNSIDDPLFDEMNADDYQRLYRLISGA